MFNHLVFFPASWPTYPKKAPANVIFERAGWIMGNQQRITRLNHHIQLPRCARLETKRTMGPAMWTRDIPLRWKWVEYQPRGFCTWNNTYSLALIYFDLSDLCHILGISAGCLAASISAARLLLFTKIWGWSWPERKRMALGDCTV